MASVEFDAPMMQRVRSALIIAEKKYRNMSSDEMIEIWQKIEKRDHPDEDLEQGNWD